MSLILTDVCTRPNGEIVRLISNLSSVQIGGVVRTFPAHWPRCAASDSRVAVIGQGGNVVELVTDSGARRTIDEVATGTAPCAIDWAEDRFIAAWIRGEDGDNNATKLRHAELDADLNLLSAITETEIPVNARGTSDGLLDFPPPIYALLERTIQLTDRDGRTQNYTLWMRRGRYTVGQNGGGPFAGGFLAFDHHTQQHMFVATMSTPLWPRAAARPDGTIVVALGGDAAVFINSASFTPASLIQIKPPSVTPLIWRAICGWRDDVDQGFTQLGNAAWAQPPDTRPVIEGVDDADQYSNLLYLYVGTENSGPSQAYIDRTVAKAKSRRCAIGVYSDNPFWTDWAESIAKTLQALGFTVVRVVQAYTFKVGTRVETPEESRDRVNAQIVKVKGRGSIGLMQRPDGIGTEDNEVRFADYCEQLIGLHGVKVQSIFGWLRPGAYARVKDYMGLAITNMQAGEPPLLIPPAPPTTTRRFFPRVRRFMSDTMTVRALQKQVEWNPNADGKGDRPIWGNVRPDGGLNQQGEGRAKVGSAISNNADGSQWDYALHPEGPQDDPPDDESKVVLNSHGIGEDDPDDIYFANGERFQLTQMPGGELQTRRHGAIDIQELWWDGRKAGMDQVFHKSGTALRVLR